jgi:hypothetical protein
MSLGPRKDVGSFVLVIKYSAKDGKLSCLDRVCEGGQWINQERDVTKDFEAVIDLKNPRIGWINYPKGAAPDTVLVPVGADFGDPPSEDHRLGVRLVMLTAEAIGADVRVLLNTSSALWDGVDELHTKFIAQAADHPDELPVVRLAEVVKRKTAQGVSFVPRFEIIRWVPRPWEIPVPVDEPLPATGKRIRPAPTSGASFGSAAGDMDDEIPF